MPIAAGQIYALVNGEEQRLGETDEAGLLTARVCQDSAVVLFIEEASGILGYPRIYSAMLSPGQVRYQGNYNRVTFQVPTWLGYGYLEACMRLNYASDSLPDSCHVVATVTPSDKTLEDCPHGVEGVSVWLEPSGAEGRFYFDMFRSGPLFCKTDMIFSLGLYSVLNYSYHLLSDPLSLFDSRHRVFTPLQALSRDTTSEDGGVMFMNVKAREKPYVIKTYHPDYQFSEVSFLCLPGTLVNISPPQGPKILTDIQPASVTGSE